MYDDDKEVEKMAFSTTFTIAASKPSCNTYCVID
jgi:hypothetical protein